MAGRRGPGGVRRAMAAANGAALNGTTRVSASSVAVAELFQQGVGDHQAGRLQPAEAAYRRVLAVEPAHAGALHLLGVLAHQCGRADLAVDLIGRAIALDGANAVFHGNLGMVLCDLGLLAEAEASLRAALRLRPGFEDAHYNLGNVLDRSGRLAESEASYRQVLKRQPDNVRALNNLGHVLRQQIRPAAAEACFRKALRLQPQVPDSHANLGIALLMAGRFEEGWREYEWRWKVKEMSPGARHFSVPLWSGEPLAGRTLLLHAEQGLGDTLQFCRYAPLITPGARVILEVQAPLARLLSGLPGVARVVAEGGALPAFDLHCPLMSLPRAFGTTLGAIPAATPYLAADPVLAAGWRARLAGLEGLKVGLVWAGGRRDTPELAAVDARRSICLATLAPLGDLSGVDFVSLQKGGPAAQTAQPPQGMVVHDFTADLGDFADTAALIDGLDLVISVDTSVAHLAGALGKPVWLLNRFDTCWRWLLGRDDSPWYPTLRQFRQAAPGDWDPVIGAVRDALQALAAGDRGQLAPRAPEA